MFEGKVRKEPTLEWTNYYFRLVMLAREKRSSLFRTFVNYGRKSFIALGPDIEKGFTTGDVLPSTLVVCCLKSVANFIN
jgi:hypothetical protein